MTHAKPPDNPMAEQLPDLLEAMKRECRERMKRAEEALALCPAELSVETCCNRVHQEFDSLHGAARAANLQGVEGFSRLVAQVARNTRKRGEQSDLDPHIRDLLEAAIQLTSRCFEGADPGSIEEQKDVRHLTHRMKSLLAPL
ncbi:MAG: Hpt domain-containing protein [Magnetococcales bacterium]|nr:Hpt domain-containing protein [Magnetococcales bacterium]